MTRPILIVQNDANEGAGLLNSLAELRRIDRRTMLGHDADYDSIEPKDFSGLVVLGGAQSAYETDRYPYLKRQMNLCRAFVLNERPIAGFCLGAQILAVALGGRAIAGRQKEIGWFDLALTDAGASDPLLSTHPQTLVAYHFHGDIIEPPASCVTLARSDLTSCQLFRYGSNVYGFQYHAEVDRRLLESMCRNNADYLSEHGLDPESIIAEADEHLAAFEQSSKGILTRWLDLLDKEPSGSQ